MTTQSELRFAGYAGLFHIADADGDTIHKGAFLETLRHQAQPIPLLWQHRTGQQIGLVEQCYEDERGLRVIASITNPNSRAAMMLKHKQVTGLSFGYRARNSRQSKLGRELLGIDLFEVSLVTHPLQYGARVHLVI